MHDVVHTYIPTYTSAYIDKQWGRHRGSVSGILRTHNICVYIASVMDTYTVTHTDTEAYTMAYTYTYAYTHTYKYTCAYIQAATHPMHTPTHTHIHIYMYIGKHIRLVCVGWWVGRVGWGVCGGGV